MHFRDTLLEINMDNAFHNIKIIKNLNPNKRIIGVVKANAYGHGLVSFSKILENYEKIDFFGTATLDEAICLRVNGINSEIIVLGGISPSYLETAYENKITLTCNNLEFAKALSQSGLEINVHIKIDTGMNRIGLKTEGEFLQCKKILDDSKINITGMYTHLSSADDSLEYTEYQIEKFKKYLKYTDKNMLIHLQNTAGSLNYPNLDFVNAIRPGIGLYGINVGEKEIDFKELINLKTTILNVKEISAKEAIGYNRTFTTEKRTYIGTIPIGYGDGYKRCYGQLYGYIGHRKFPIRGRVCMDQTMLEVDKTVKYGDYINLIGDNCTIEEIGQITGVSPYEVLTSLSSRLFRKFSVGGKFIAWENQILDAYIE